MKSRRIIFIILILFFILFNAPYPAKAAFRDDVNPDEAAQFVAQERAKSEAEFQKYMKEKEQEQVKNETNVPQPRKEKKQSNLAKISIVFLALCGTIITVFWLLPHYPDKKG